MSFDAIKEFPVVIFGNLEKYNDVISKARVRIFYKGLNRNGTYITEEFAEKLLSTLSYSPVKGIYDTYDEDFTDHGKARTEGRAYGVVPETANIAWEDHVDEDGIKRTYACADVLLWTGLYEEANKIPGKSQSMELYEPSILGEWRVIENNRCFVFTDGCFLGLQALGDTKEPCFEGSAFFSLFAPIQEMYEEIKKFNLNFQLESNKGGKSEMPNKINFKLSDNQKANAIFSLLNPNFNEAGGWEISYGLIDTYDGYALVFDYAHGEYQRVEYTKDDKSDTVTLGAKKKCYILDITEEEKAALDALRSANGDTFMAVDTKFGTIATLTEDNQAKEQKIEELNTSIATLTTERDTAQASLETANASLSTLQTELDGLKEYKLKVDKQEKEAVVARYEELLDEEVIGTYTTKLAEMTVESLEKELAFELVKSNPTVFTKNPQMVPKNQPKGGIEGILDKYKK